MAPVTRAADYRPARRGRRYNICRDSFRVGRRQRKCGVGGDGGGAQGKGWSSARNAPCGPRTLIEATRPRRYGHSEVRPRGPTGPRGRSPRGSEDAKPLNNRAHQARRARSTSARGRDIRRPRRTEDPREARNSDVEERWPPVSRPSRCKGHRPRTERSSHGARWSSGVAIPRTRNRPRSSAEGGRGHEGVIFHGRGRRRRGRRVQRHGPPGPARAVCRPRRGPR